MKTYFRSELSIGAHRIGLAHPVYIIAEAGVNHDGDLEKAFRLIEAAKESGAHAVKFQAFNADRLVSKGTPKVRHHVDPDQPGETHFDMIRRLEIDETFQKKIYAYCVARDILFLSTPYDVESAKFLHETLNVAAFKTASADIVDVPLQRYIASTGKLSIVAVGMATPQEIQDLLDIYEVAGNLNVILLHCTSSYPASPASLNLNVIPVMREDFRVLVGYSDHSLGNAAAIASTALGSCMIERHFTLDKTAPGPDHKASVEPDEFKRFVADIRLTKTILGSTEKTVQPEEEDMRAFSRKSLHAARRIREGETVDETVFALKRPGTGLSWKEGQQLLGRIAVRDVAEDTMLTENMFRSA